MVRYSSALTQCAAFAVLGCCLATHLGGTRTGAYGGSPTTCQLFDGGRRSGIPRNEPLITLDDLEDVPSSMPRQLVSEPHEVPLVRSRGAWEGSDVWQ